LLTTGIARAIPLARLIEFGCINSPEANALAAQVEAVAVHDLGACVSGRYEGTQGENGDERGGGSRHSPDARFLSPR